MSKPENEELASSYRIRQKQIQEVKDNEVGFKNVFMGLALVYADSIEVLDDLVSPEGLEYKLTTTMSKMINTTSALAGLKDNVEITRKVGYSTYTDLINWVKQNTQEFEHFLVNSRILVIF